MSTKEESAQLMSDEDSAQMSSEEESAQLMSEEEPSQLMGEDESVQLSVEEESAQLSNEEEPSQLLSESTRSNTTTGVSNGQMSPDLKSNLESNFNVSFSSTKVVPESPLPGKVKAKALAKSEEVHFAPGEFKPDTPAGNEVIAHEFTHVVQQREGRVKPTTSMNGVAINDDPALEAEAREKGKKFAEKEAEKQGGEGANQGTGGDSSGGGAEGQSSGSTGGSQGANSGASKSSSSKPEALGGEATPTPESKAKGEVEGKAEGAGEKMEEPSVPRSPEEDPNFKAVQSKVKSVADDQQSHDPASQEASEAQAAAPIASNERSGSAAGNQVGEMAEEEPGVFDAAAFKAKLMQRIQEMKLPENQSEADDFEDNNDLDSVKKGAQDDLSEEKEQATGPIDKTSKEDPDESKVPERKVTPMPPPKTGKAPKPVDTAAGIPPKRPESEVSAPLQENMAEVDQEMADNEVTEEQLAKSNEPTFTSALDSKKKAKEHTDTAPGGFRKAEGAVAVETQQQAQAEGAEKVSGMHSQRDAIMQLIQGQKGKAGSKDSEERRKVAEKIHGIYQDTKKEVDEILKSLDEEVEAKFDEIAAAAKKAFEDEVDRKMDAYKDERYSGLIGAGRWIKDKFLGLPDEVNAFFTEGRQTYINEMDKGLTVIAELVASKLQEATARIEQGRNEVAEYVQSLPGNLRSVGKQAADAINSKFDQLQENVNSKQDELIDSLADKYNQQLQAVDARIEEMKAANRGLIDMALSGIKGVIEVIKNIKEMFKNLLSGVMDAITAIITDPIGFLGKLIEGVTQGFKNFGANIMKHLTAGLVAWLTGALGPIGITIPENLLSLKGIFSLVAQILGLSWDFIRRKAVKLLGEKVVGALETGFEIFKIIATEGISGLWNFIKEKFQDLKATVIDAIKDMIITQVVQAAIKWVLGLLSPAGAFIKAAMMIIDVVKFFVQRGSQIIELVNAFVQGIRAIASGNVSAVAEAIENALAKAIPVVIGFLASLLGISGLANKVTKIIKKIRQRIEKVIDMLIMKAKKFARKLFGKGKNGATGNKEHDEKVSKGLAFLKEEENRVDSNKDKKLTQEQASSVASKTKAKHKIFKSIVAVEEGGKWTYKYKASEGKLESDKSIEGEVGGTRVSDTAYDLDPPFNLYRGSAKASPEGKAEAEKEFRSQVEKQQNGINGMKAKKWMTNRETFVDEGRAKGNLKELRDLIRSQIGETYVSNNYDKLIEEVKEENPGISEEDIPDRVEEKGEKYAKTILTRHHAILHNPDQVAGGEIDVIIPDLKGDGAITDADAVKASIHIGHAGANSSIGSQWGKQNRVQKMYKWTEEELEKFDDNKKGEVLMHVKLLING